LYQILRTIETLTKIKLDLTKSSHRVFVNDFITQITPYIESITSKEKEGEELIKKTEQDLFTGMASGCGFLLIVSIGGLFTAGIVGFVSGIVFGIFAMIIGSLIDNSNKDRNKRKLDEAKFQAERMKNEATEELNRVLQDFLSSHPLE
jgi:hypothetical protein